MVLTAELSITVSEAYRLGDTHFVGLGDQLISPIGL